MSASGIGLTLQAVLTASDDLAKAYLVYQAAHSALLSALVLHAAALKDAPPPGPPPPDPMPRPNQTS